MNHITDIFVRLSNQSRFCLTHSKIDSQVNMRSFLMPEKPPDAQADERGSDSRLRAYTPGKPAIGCGRLAWRLLK